jgi:hypothetical protein
MDAEIKGEIHQFPARPASLRRGPNVILYVSSEYSQTAIQPLFRPLTKYIESLKSRNSLPRFEMRGSTCFLL